MSTLTILVKNNLHLLFRSRTSLVAVVLVPLLVLALAGLAFDTTNIYRVKIGVWAASYSDFGTSVVAMLEDSQFKVVRHGSQRGSVTLSDRKLHVERPRMRRKGVGRGGERGEVGPGAGEGVVERGALEHRFDATREVRGAELELGDERGDGRQRGEAVQLDGAEGQEG